MSDYYVLGQGKVFLDEIDPITKRAKEKSRYVGNVPEDGFIIAPQTQTLEHFESYTGFNRKDQKFENQQMAQVTIRMENIDKENLAVAMFGNSLSIAAGTVTAEAHTAHRGYSFHLNRINATAFTSLTSAETEPTTYVAGTDYQIVNLKTGEIFIPEDSGIFTPSNPDAVQVRANYTAGEMDRVTGFSRINTELWVRFNGVNIAGDQAPIIAEVFKVRFNPVSALDFIKNNFPGMQLELIGEALYEPLLDTVPGYEGGFYRVSTV